GPQEEEHPSVPEEQEERRVQLEMGGCKRLRSGEHRARRDREQQGDDDRSGDARSRRRASQFDAGALDEERLHQFLPSPRGGEGGRDRKSTRLNSSHGSISYAVFCLKKKTKQ